MPCMVRMYTGDHVVNASNKRDVCTCVFLRLQDAGVSATPGPEKKRSRWDETPANASSAGGFGATPAAGAGLPFGATPAFTPGMVAGEGTACYFAVVAVIHPGLSCMCLLGLPCWSACWPVVHPVTRWPHGISCGARKDMDNAASCSMLTSEYAALWYALYSQVRPDASSAKVLSVNLSCTVCLKTALCCCRHGDASSAWHAAWHANS